MTEQKEQKAKIHSWIVALRANSDMPDDNPEFREIADYIEKSLKRDELLENHVTELSQDGEMPFCRAWALMKLQHVLKEVRE